MGRKGLYDTKVKPYLDKISEWYQDLDERQIAVERLGIAVSTFEKYKKEHPELQNALHKGKDHLIAELKSALKKKAKGFTYEEKKHTVRKEGGKIISNIETYTKYSPPDTGAIHLLLKNLDPEWRNDDMTTIELKKEQNEIAKKKAEKDDW